MRAFREAAPEAVIHLAAENGAQRSEAKLRAANVAGLEHLSRPVARASRPRASSSCRRS